MARQRKKDLQHRASLAFLAVVVLGLAAWNLDVLGLFYGGLGFTLLLAAIFVQSRRQPKRRWRRIIVGIAGIIFILLSGLADLEGDKSAKRASSSYRGAPHAQP